MVDLKGTSAYSKLRGTLGLQDQDIQSLKIKKIVKSDNLTYDVYVTFVIDEEEYWGVINNIMGLEPEFKSEVFKDSDLYQPKEWVIKIKGLVIKTIKEWLKPEPGHYKLINDEVLLLCKNNEILQNNELYQSIHYIYQKYSELIVIEPDIEVNNENYCDIMKQLQFKMVELNKNHLFSKHLSEKTKEKIRLASIGNKNHFFGKFHSEKS